MRGCDARLGFYEHLEKLSSGTRAKQGRIKPVSAVFAITRVMSQMQTVFNFMILQQEQFTGGIARPVKTVAVPFPSSLSLPLFLSLLPANSLPTVQINTKYSAQYLFMEKRAQQTGQQHVNTLVLGNMRACMYLPFPPFPSSADPRCRNSFRNHQSVNELWQKITSSSYAKYKEIVGKA